MIGKNVIFAFTGELRSAYIFTDYFVFFKLPICVLFHILLFQGTKLKEKEL